MSGVCCALLVLLQGQALDVTAAVDRARVPVGEEVTLTIQVRAQGVEGDPVQRGIRHDHEPIDRVIRSPWEERPAELLCETPRACIRVRDSVPALLEGLTRRGGRTGIHG